jgi:hypothetical protein
MIFLDFGKGNGFANKPAKPLAQRIIPALDMRSLSRVLADASVSAAKHIFVRLPKVTDRLCAAISLRHVFLELFTNICATPANGIGHDFACASAQANPQPRFVGLLLHE